MDETPNTSAIDEQVGGSSDFAQKSIMEQLREQRDRISESQVVDLPVPGYDGLLVARHRLMDPKEFDKIGKKIRKQTKDTADRVVLIALDVIIESNVGVYYKSDDDQLQDLNGSHMTFSSPKLAEELGFPADTARDIVLGVFADNHVAVAQYSQRIARWMNDTTQSVTDDLLGE